MKIELSMDGILYEGTAVPFEKPGSDVTQYVVRLQDMPVFHVYKSVQDEWTSDDLSEASLVNAIGKEIDRADTMDRPGTTVRTQATGTENEIIKDGEIVNEPEDVAEHAFDHTQKEKP